MLLYSVFFCLWNTLYKHICFCILLFQLKFMSFFLECYHYMNDLVGINELVWIELKNTPVRSGSGLGVKLRPSFTQRNLCWRQIDRWQIDYLWGIFLLNPARSLLPSLCASVCPCVRVSVDNIAQKAFHRSTSFSMGESLHPWTQGWSDSVLKKKCPGVRVGVCVCVCGGRSKFGPNDKR